MCHEINPLSKKRDHNAEEKAKIVIAQRGSCWDKIILWQDSENQNQKTRNLPYCQHTRPKVFIYDQKTKQDIEYKFMLKRPSGRKRQYSLSRDEKKVKQKFAGR